MTSALLSILAAYLVGGFPIGLIIGHMAQGIDIRKFGSGNIGASNVWRTLGWKWGAPTFVLDVLKGFWPVLASHHIPHAFPALPVLVGIAAIAGHNFSPFLGFKGGKGVATSLGVALGLQFKGAIIGFGAWGLVLLLTRYISVASMVATVVATLLIWLHNRYPAYAWFGVLTTASVIFKHIPNIKRVIAGTEPKVFEKKPVVSSTEIPQSQGDFLMTQMPRLILASTSPRRRELLSVFGLPFEVIGGDFDEDSIASTDYAPGEWVVHLAVGKALTVANQTTGDALVIGADTTVVLDGLCLGKPTDPAHAVAMLHRLSDRTHQVYTGITIIPVTNGVPGTPVSDFAVTDVTFDPIPADVITAYVATGEPLDKAGAYGIQGKALAFIPRIKGDYFNVVGLPLNRLCALLEQFGVSVW